MKKKKILHITNWYPNEGNPYEGIFVKEHIKSIDPYFDNEIIHLKCERSKGLFKIKKESQSNQHTAYIFYSSLFKYHRLCVYTLFWMQVYLFSVKRKLKHVSVVNYHVAPTLCIYLKFLKSFYIKERAVFLIEHYSAYHGNFGLKKGSKRLNHIRKIFKNQFTLITVSHQLRKDIEEFCGFNLNHLQPKVLNNVVDEQFFNSNDLYQDNHLQFLMVANWSGVKRPLTLIKAFAETQLNKDSKLVIIGDGEYLPQMKELVKKYEIDKAVTFLGQQPKELVAREMKNSSVFLHSSDYETFSVVCAEALCCGCFVIANSSEAIAEYLENQDGIFIKTESEWNQHLSNFHQELLEIREKRSVKYLDKFNFINIGSEYNNIIKKK